jgi:hypothetical protein
MDHQIQHLTSLRLKLKGFRFGCHNGSVTRRGEDLQDDRNSSDGAFLPLHACVIGCGRRPHFASSSTKLMDMFQDGLTFFVACQRSKSAPRMKNFRPI